jgi:hypothetical protein
MKSEIYMLELKNRIKDIADTKMVILKEVDKGEFVFKRKYFDY